MVKNVKNDRIRLRRLGAKSLSLPDARNPPQVEIVAPYEVQRVLASLGSSGPVSDDLVRRWRPTEATDLRVKSLLTTIRTPQACNGVTREANILTACQEGPETFRPWPVSLATAHDESPPGGGTLPPE